MRLLAFGDLHLGHGSNLGREPGDRLHDQEAVLEQILDFAVKEDVDAILDAGDTFEGPAAAITPEQLAVFAEFVKRAWTHSKPVVAISGNGKHDAAVRPVNGVAIFDHLPGINVLSMPDVVRVAGGAVCCLPWVSPARLVAARIGDGVERERVVEEAQRLLVTIARGLREDAGDGPAVLMLHGSLSGASIPSGLSTDQLGAVIDTDALLEQGWDAIVASHIHVPQAYHSEIGWTQSIYPEAPGAVLYTGSPMPLNFGETNVPHGCWILDVGEKETRAEFVPIESRPLLQWDVELDDEGMVDLGIGDMPEGAIVKIRVRGTRAQVSRLDINHLRRALLDEGAHTVKIDVDTVREQRSRADGVTDDLSPLDAFDAWAAVNEAGADVVRAAREQMQADLEAVGA